MRKKSILSFLLALMLCISLGLPAYAEGEEDLESVEPEATDLVLAEDDSFTEEERFPEEEYYEPVDTEPEQNVDFEVYSVVFVYGDGRTEEQWITADQADDFGYYGVLLKPEAPAREDANGLHYEFEFWAYSDGTDFFGDQDYALLYDSAELTARWRETPIGLEDPTEELVAEDPAEEPAEELAGEAVEEAAEAHTHRWGEPVWVWRRISGSWDAGVVFVCDACGEKQIINAELTEDTAPGTKTVTALAVFEGAAYTVSRTDEVLYFVTLDGVTVNAYRLGEYCLLTWGDGREARDWYIDDALAAEGCARYGFIVTANTDVVTAA